MFTDRQSLYRDLERERGSKVITYVTGDRPGMETKIHSEVYDFFVNHLDEIGVTPKISLLLYTKGGETLTAWSLVNLLRQFCDELEVIIPSKCLSAGTIMALGANKIIMTKQATLGPIDPSLTSPLNPIATINGQESISPVSVEDIKAYLALAKDELGIQNPEDSINILLKLSEKVHPLVLGSVYRAQTQIQMLARRLLTHQVSESDKIERIVSFLCSDSGSHDYTISRREATNDLGLTIEKPSETLYGLINSIYLDIKSELELGRPFDVNTTLGPAPQQQYTAVRALVESTETCSYQMRTQGLLQRVQVSPPPMQQFAINNTVNYEGWKRHDEP
ncbi:serine protease [Raoultella ornithinolytica]|uniref:Serine protease n=2 Tax=Enterobacteriaceae TaxID=543 RepID=A0A9Q9J729_RAOOR|nr:serine protease [Raoultella ornithinolytica]ELV3660494.1 serine protease [Raoultella ornithinolytica]UXE36134.1 serine protease [Raoultella ornithinolytica]HEP0605740.1 serine protease [Raoultella ornithinolytica]